MQSSHDCMHIPHVPPGSDLLHDLNCFFEEQVGHGAEIKPLCLSQAGSTEWTVARSVTAVGLLLSMALQFLGYLPSALALVSMGIQQMSPLGEATQHSRLGPRVYFSSQVCLPRFCSTPPPSLDEGWGLSMNDLAIVPSNSFLGLQYY